VTSTRLELLPEYRGVSVVPRARDYLVDGERYQRVTTALGIIAKPALVGWAKRVTLEKVREILLDTDVSSSLLNAAYGVGEGDGPDVDYTGWVERVLATAGAAADKQRDTLAELGTEAHRLIAQASPLGSTVQGQLRGFVPRELRPAYDGALRFLSDQEITVVDTEMVVWSPEWGVAGTVDGVGWQGEKLVIWDWKRSSGMYWETALQLAAYRELLHEITGHWAERAYAVRLLREAPEEGEAWYEVKVLTLFAPAFEAYKNAVGLQRASNKKFWESA
jgi:hypothetical protein